MATHLFRGIALFSISNVHWFIVKYSKGEDEEEVWEITFRMGGSGRDVNAHGTGGSHGGVVQGRSNVIKKREDRERQKALKRPSSEEPLDEEERDRKKGRFVEDFDDNDATSPRDNREKKRKKKKQRKRPIPVIVAGGGETSQRSEHNVMGSGLHSSSETLVKVNGMKDEDDSDDKAPTYSVCFFHVACLFLSSRWLIPFSFSSRLIRGKARRSLIHPNPCHLKPPILIITTLDLGVTQDRILVRQLLKVLINFLRLLDLKSNLPSKARQVMILVFNALKANTNYFNLFIVIPRRFFHSLPSSSYSKSINPI